jgi:SpoVK/Ycf46/Vps4 family AAA+-type ATPase
MPSSVVLSKLFKAIATRDLRSAAEIAEGMIVKEERSGHRSAAALLRGALNTNGLNGGSLAVPAIDVVSSMIRERPGPPLDEVVLTADARRELLEFAAEWTYQNDLSKCGLSRRVKALFFGPPGCGKTLAARSLGTLMNLPVFTVRFSSVVGAYLGQTGANLRSVFRFAETTPCILLLDEFDAIARTRGRSDDVGELDRVVISLLQEFDHTVPSGIVIAATNVPDSLDPAIWRRFDMSVEFPAPSRAELRRFLTRFGNAHEKRARKATPAIPRDLRSYADVEKWAIDRRRRELLRSFSAPNAKARRT